MFNALPLQPLPWHVIVKLIMPQTKSHMPIPKRKKNFNVVGEERTNLGTHLRSIEARQGSYSRAGGALLTIRMSTHLLLICLDIDTEVWHSTILLYNKLLIIRRWLDKDTVSKIIYNFFCINFFLRIKVLTW